MRMKPRKRRAQDVPAGQPHAYPLTDKVPHRSGKELPRFQFPHQIIDVRSKRDLDRALEHYRHPFPMMEGSEHPKNVHAMRYMIERVFPALRWFCRVYNEDVPSWLEGNGWADGISTEDHKRFFGEKPLDVREFKENKSLAGERA